MNTFFSTRNGSKLYGDRGETLRGTGRNSTRNIPGVYKIVHLQRIIIKLFSGRCAVKYLCCSVLFMLNEAVVSFKQGGRIVE